jgi:hypothetical protein
MIPITPSLCTNKMFKDIRDAHNQEKNKKERKKNKDPVGVLNHSQQ